MLTRNHVIFLAFVLTCEVAAYGASLSADFKGGTSNVTITNKGGNAFECRFPNGGRDAVGWFLFRLDNDAKQKIHITLTNVPIKKWRTVNPVYCHTNELGDLAAYEPTNNRIRMLESRNGPAIPDNLDSNWKFITDVTANEAAGSLAFEREFLPGTTCIAMRPPYVNEYNDSFRKWAGNQRNAIVHDIGITPGGRKIFVLQIGGLSERSRSSNPTLLIYAREHADEHDASWVAEGAARYLLSGSRPAKTILENMTLLVIPILDQDGAADSVYSRITHSFAPKSEFPEVLAYGQFFHNWINQGNRIDHIVNMHNVESSEATHLTCAYMEPEKSREYPFARHDVCLAFHGTIINSFNGTNIDVGKSAWAKRYGTGRLGEFLRISYGSLHIPYEANSQAAKRHLTLDELRLIGQKLVESTYVFHRSPVGRTASFETNKKHSARIDAWKRYAPIIRNYEISDPYTVETWLHILPGMEKEWKRTGESSLDFSIINQSGGKP